MMSNKFSHPVERKKMKTHFHDIHDIYEKHFHYIFSATKKLKFITFMAIVMIFRVSSKWKRKITHLKIFLLKILFYSFNTFVTFNFEKLFAKFWREIQKVPNARTWIKTI